MQSSTDTKPLAPGAELLSLFLSDHGITQSACASALGVTGPAVHDWLTGRRRPSAPFRSAIELWTRKAVPASSWALPGESDPVASVRPFRRRAAGGSR